MAIPVGDFEIVDGPSREEIFDSLRLFKEQRLLNFEVRLKKENLADEDWGLLRHIDVRISSIQAITNEENSWVLIGGIREPDKDCFDLTAAIFFNARTRKGKVEIRK